MPIGLIQPDIHVSDKDIVICNHFPTNKLTIIHKPFIFYALMFWIRIVVNYYIYRLGFTNIIDPATQLRVWIKHQPAATNKVPLVFIHGLGFGIVLYLWKIRSLSADRTLILPELPNVSYDLYTDVKPSADNIVVALYDVLIRQGVELVDLIGHSYGGTILNIFQIKYPHMCNYKTYIESPVFCIHQSHTAKIVYMKPTSWSVRKYIMYLFIFSDTHVQYIIKRSMFADQGMIKNFDDKTTVILAKDDYLVPSYYIHRYITAHYPQVNAIMTAGDHGAYIFG
jgi:pimeloyl-ACP methyl ester carboxylesterase